MIPPAKCTPASWNAPYYQFILLFPIGHTSSNRISLKRTSTHPELASKVDPMLMHGRSIPSSEADPLEARINNPPIFYTVLHWGSTDYPFLFFLAWRDKGWSGEWHDRRRYSAAELPAAESSPQEGLRWSALYSSSRLFEFIGNNYSRKMLCAH